MLVFRFNASQFHGLSQCARTFRTRVFFQSSYYCYRGCYCGSGCYVLYILSIMSGIKRNILTVKERMDVLKDLETTSMTQVAIAHKIHIRTVFRIKKEAANIAQIAKSANGAKIKRRRKPKFPELEQQLYTWFVERKTLGDKLSDTLLLEKARDLQDSIKLHPSSKISMGWLHRFKKRNNIRLVHLYRKKTSTDEAAAQSFANELKKQIEEEGIDLKCIYNMDETELLWKALPSKILARNEEVHLSGNKKEKVTIALCANATGTHKLKPFFIYKYKKPKALKNGTNELPVIYASQKNAWMDQKLFLEWFSYFKESVKLFQLQEGICSKIILLLDNCEARKLPINYTDDINIEIKYLPPNTKYLIQPMDQGTIVETKQIFRHKLMQRVITYTGGTTEFDKMYNIKDCIIMLDNAWADVTSNNIKNSWHKLLLSTPIHGEVGREGEEEEEEDIPNVLTTCHIEEKNQTQDECRNENMVQGRWDEGADVTSNNIKNSWHKLLPCTRIHGEVGREGEEVEEEDVKNVLTTCHLEERNQTQDECRNENMVQGSWDEAADVRSNNIKNSWHKLLPCTRIHGEVGREGEEEVEEKDVKNVLTTCHLEERNQTQDECRNENMVQGRWDEGADVRSNNIKNSWHKLLPCTRIHGEVGREGEEEVEEEDVKNVLTTCHLEERNQTQDECRIENMVQGRRDEGASVTQQTGGLPLNVEERRRLEYVFAELEVFNDRASPAMQAQAKSLKLLYLGPT